MTDQERLADFLSSEKKLAANCDIFASECVSTALRDDYVKIFTLSHADQTELFKLAQSRGWYQVEQAPENKVSQAYTQCANRQPKG